MRATTTVLNRRIMMNLLRVLLLLLASGSAIGDRFTAVADTLTPADITFSALLLSQERKGTAIAAQELNNEDIISLRPRDILAIRADVVGGITNSMKFSLYLRNGTGRTLVREQIESFEPFTVFGNTPPDVYNGYTDFQDGDIYRLQAETYLFRRAEGAVMASKEITFKVTLNKLTASDAAEQDRFGSSVAISGDILVVGSPFDDDAGSLSGSAYVFQRDGHGWSEVAKLRAADAATNDLFGDSVAISGQTIVVGASRDDDGASDSGSAYVFRSDDDWVTWSQVAKLRADDAATADQFGSSVAISGDILVVGSPLDDDAGSGSGSAYVFQRDDGEVEMWSEVAKLRSDDAATVSYTLSCI